MRFSWIIISVVILIGGSVYAQDADIQALVDSAGEAVKSSEFSPVITNDQLLEDARKRVAGIERPDVDYDGVSQALGYDFKAEMERGAPMTQETLYVFVSFSMSDDLIRSYVQDVAEVGGIVVISGLIDDDFMTTVKKVQTFVELEEGKSRGGVMIDPKAFETFSVSSVPTILLAERQLIPCLDAACERDIPVHDRIVGSVSIEHALSLFARSGDLKSAAQDKYERISNDIYSAYRE